MRGSNASLKQLAVGGKQTKIKIGKSGPSSQEQGEGYLCFEVGGHSSLSLSLALIHPLHMNDGVQGERGPWGRATSFPSSLSCWLGLGKPSSERLTREPTQKLQEGYSMELRRPRYKLPVNYLHISLTLRQHYCAALSRVGHLSSPKSLQIKAQWTHASCPGVQRSSAA